MKRIREFLRSLVSDDKGITSLEYVLIALLALAAIAAAYPAIRNGMKGGATNIGSQLSGGGR